MGKRAKDGATNAPVKTGVMSKIKSCANWLMPFSIKNILTSLIHKTWEGVRNILSLCNKTEETFAEQSRDFHDETNPSKYLVYKDANNLYEWAMQQDLPTHGFEWMTDDELDGWRQFSEVKGIGCILEADLEYPDELHDVHNDYPLIRISSNW